MIQISFVCSSWSCPSERIACVHSTTLGGCEPGHWSVGPDPVPRTIPSGGDVPLPWHVPRGSPPPERTWAHGHPSAGPLGDDQLDAVSVEVAPRQRQEYLKVHGGRASGVRRSRSHGQDSLAIGRDGGPRYVGRRPIGLLTGWHGCGGSGDCSRGPAPDDLTRRLHGFSQGARGLQ